MEDRAELLVALDDALARLGECDARQARVVECRFFGGMTEEETAEALGIGLRTAKRDWSKAKSWLYQEIYPD
jgi:RNA polymerase sigma factor (sigma-70 family)